MLKFIIAHYGMEDAPMLVNGGKLVIHGGNYTVRCFLRTVAVFPSGHTTVRRLTDQPLFDGLELRDGEKVCRLYFHKETARQVYEYFGI